jgi:hypothetical protein
MKPLHRRLAFLFWVTAFNAFGCGPFFPDTVLDLPQAALRVRASCLLDEMVAIDRSHGRKLSLRPAGLAMIRRSQNENSNDWQLSLDDEIRKIQMQLLDPVIAAGMPAELAEKMKLGALTTSVEAIDLAVILLKKQVAATRVAEIVTAFSTWRESLPKVDLDGPWKIAAPERAEVPAPPDFPEVPRDIAAYWLAARAWRSGDLASARTAWQAILDLPANDHLHRAVWAAWMLAKTSPDESTAVPLYHKTVVLAESGLQDVLGLSSLAMGWIAMTETDPIAGMKGYFDAACSGNEDMLISLLQQRSKVFTGGDAVLSRAAADPLAREIVTALFFMSYGPNASTDRGDDSIMTAWLSQLEKLPPSTPSPSAAKAAWICYSRGDFEASRRWLGQAPANAGEVLWLQAKLALRDGRMDDAARLFAKAAPIYQFSPNEQPDAPRLEEVSWYDHDSRRDWMRGQFQSDRAIVHIGRGEFLLAMNFLSQARYDQDAAYLAERVLNTDELVSWIKQHRPTTQAEDASMVFRMGADGEVQVPDGDWIGDRLRYILARRLAREFRFREAAGFMPAALRPIFNHYVQLHREARSGAWPTKTKAVILWNLASLHRKLGMKFFGYEGAPDNTEWDGGFTAMDFVGRRLLKTGWHFDSSENEPSFRKATNDLERAVPVISLEEIQRLAKYRASSEQRFHYRYDAAEIAWRAASLLPDNHPSTLYILHEAGRWLASRNPRAADRFYQEIVRRCSKLPQGREIDLRRWFLPMAPENPPTKLPATLRFSPPEVVDNSYK